ncbi:hypothetical protein ULMS_23720 [Patiriisocius marinistellae]|uniref:DUF5673 domain-containing protein n=1 Tax=Patiriisocius marinistellae TaxID=2494560 RepID=A0A5J4G050_9FLAO|nr:hypothetical protein [Patiriisocius marinistellae]GEQ86864.1 hypothetical protein ULMS_23720 [Patiriisocius marinistellae]
MRVFREVQKFRQWWFILIIIATTCVVFYGLFEEYKEVEKESSTDLITFIVSALFALLVIAIIFIFKLETKINEQGIYYGFWPFQLKLKHVPWSEIKKIYVREYSPISEYGGWGYRFSFGKHGKAYNVSGSTGIQIIFKNGKKTLIGTQKKEEVESVLKTYQHKLLHT